MCPYYLLGSTPFMYTNWLSPCPCCAFFRGGVDAAWLTNSPRITGWFGPNATTHEWSRSRSRNNRREKCRRSSSVRYRLFMRRCVPLWLIWVCEYFTLTLQALAKRCNAVDDARAPIDLGELQRLMAHHHTTGKTVIVAATKTSSQSKTRTDPGRTLPTTDSIYRTSNTPDIALTPRDMTYVGMAAPLCCAFECMTQTRSSRSTPAARFAPTTKPPSIRRPRAFGITKATAIWQGDMYSTYHKQKRGANNRASTPTAFDPSSRRVGFPGLQDARTSLVSQHAIHQHGHCSRGYPSTEIRA